MKTRFAASSVTASVGLAAIQDLNQKVEEKEAEIQSLKEESAAIKKTLQKITQQRNDV